MSAYIILLHHNHHCDIEGQSNFLDAIRSFASIRPKTLLETDPIEVNCYSKIDQIIEV